MKKLFFVVLFLFPLCVHADDNSIFEQRLNWVRLDKVSQKKIPHTLSHPNTQFSASQIKEMLLSIKIAKRYFLSHEIDNIDVFDEAEADKYASLLLEGLGRANDHQVVLFSIVHKRPISILRNDLVTLGSLFVAEDGVHFKFVKLFAALSGDYEASGQRLQALNSAHSLKVSLDAGVGQQLSYEDSSELIINPAVFFSAPVAPVESKTKKEKQITVPAASAVSHTEISGHEKTIADRLKELDQLKTDGKVSDKEYNKLREKILGEL